MPDLKFATLLEETRSDRLRAALEPVLGATDGPYEIESTRLQAPVCYWVVYRAGNRRATLKSFFSAEEYARYQARLADVYPDRLGHAEHPLGGLVFLPELNGVLWGFPFDPVMPSLDRCLDGGWIAEALGRRRIAELLGRRSSGALQPELVSYDPEAGAIFSYCPGEGWDEPVAYGKVAPEDTSGLVYVVMNRLWRSPARRSGQLRLARPLAFRPEAGLLLQAAVPGAPIGRERNRKIFLDLVESAGPALAAIHTADLPFGPERRPEGLLARLERGLDDLALTAPPLHRTLRRLLNQLVARAERGTGGPTVPSHGDFKWDQLLHHEGQFSLIDFELVCQAEPAFDVGYFCAYLPPSSPRDWRDGTAVEMLREAFLRAYAVAAAEHSDLRVDPDRVALYEATTLALRALTHAWQHHATWQIRASQLLDLAFERLVSPMPDAAVAHR